MMLNPFIHYECSGVLSGCEWGFGLWGFVSVGFCPYTGGHRASKSCSWKITEVDRVCAKGQRITRDVLSIT